MELKDSECYLSQTGQDGVREPRMGLNSSRSGRAPVGVMAERSCKEICGTRTFLGCSLLLATLRNMVTLDHNSQVAVE